MAYISQICKQQAKRLRVPIAEDALQSDQRPPVLFLRGFSDEEQPLPSYRSWHNLGYVDTLLEDIFEEFKKIGPVVGLTNPQLVDRPANYSPYDTKSDYWQARVQELISRAGVIVLVVSATPSVAWEIQQLQSNNRLSDTLFILRAGSTAGDSIGGLRWLVGQLQMLPEPDLSVRGEGHPLVALFDGTQIHVFMKSTYDIYHYIHAVRGALRERDDITRK